MIEHRTAPLAISPAIAWNSSRSAPRDIVRGSAVRAVSTPPRSTSDDFITSGRGRGRQSRLSPAPQNRRHQKRRRASSSRNGRPKRRRRHGGWWWWYLPPFWSFWSSSSSSKRWASRVTHSKTQSFNFSSSTVFFFFCVVVFFCVLFCVLLLLLLFDFLSP